MSAEILQKPKEDARREVNWLYSLIPKKIRRFVIWVCLLLFFFTLFTSSYQAFAFWKNLPSDSKKLSCDDKRATFSSSFLDDESCKWLGLDGIIFLQDEKNIVRPKISENFLGGRDIFFPVPIPSSFQMTTRFIPLNPEKINIAINYGYVWRIIIGDGDYNRVIMQRNQAPDKQNLGKYDWTDIPEINDKKWIRPNHRLDPNKEVAVNIVSRPREGTSVVHINVTVSGYIDGTIQKKDFDFDYNVETSGPAVFTLEKVGIGLLDPFNEGIETKLINFELHK